MSGRYVLEPPTSGEVVLNTTHGEIHVELWTREAPLACRNFIQLCMESCYDNSPFYRVIPGFMVQVGPEDQTESIYGGSFKDEFHSRLKFSHRGIVAMANSKRDDNRTHFFITLDKTPWLDRKNTIFGKVGNNTIYNVIKISEGEVDKNDTPVVLPRILSAKVIISPFNDIVPREKAIAEKAAPVIFQAKLPVNKAIISYEEDELDDGNHVSKIISSHDALEDPKLSKSVLDHADYSAPAKATQPKPFNPGHSELEEDERDFDLNMKKKILEKKNIILETPITVGSYNISFKEGATIVSKIPDPEDEFNSLKKNLQLKLKKDPLGTNNLKVQQEAKQEETFLSPLEKLRYNYYQYSKKTKGKEKETLGKLNNFLDKIRSQDDKKEWFGNKLKFSVDSRKAYSFNKDLPTKNVKSDDEDYIVVDPIKRLKKHNEETEQMIDSLEKALSYENLLKISNINKN
jgi:peptidyl-prolyl cis-trans isomerase SDCCAG10